MYAPAPGMGQVTSSTPTSCPMFQTLQANSSGVVSCQADSGGQLLMDVVVLPATLLIKLVPSLSTSLQGELGVPGLAVSVVAWLGFFSFVGGSR